MHCQDEAEVPRKVGMKIHQKESKSTLFHNLVKSITILVALGALACNGSEEKPGPTRQMRLIPTRFTGTDITLELIPAGRGPCLYLIDRDRDGVPEGIRVPALDVGGDPSPTFDCAITPVGETQRVECPQGEGETLLELKCWEWQPAGMQCEVMKYKGTRLGAMINEKQFGWVDPMCHQDVQVITLYAPD